MKRRIKSNNESNNSKDDVKVKLRRAHSLAKAEQITAKEKKTRSSQLDRPCHDARDSLFSATSGFNRFEGFINWGALILFLGGTRLFLENVLNYGIRISPFNMAMWIWQENRNYSYIHTSIVLLFGNFHYVFAYTLEVLMSKDKLSHSLGLGLQIGNMIVVVLLPIVLTQMFSNSFSLMGRSILCIVHTLSFTKLWSYVQVNYWCRNLRKDPKYKRHRSFSFRHIYEESEEETSINSLSEADRSFSYTPIEYPQNLSLSDLYYFLAAPTMCYELNFPRNSRIRKRFLFKRLLEVFVLTNLILGLFQQWIIPSVRNSFKPFSDMDYMRCMERILKLSIPNHLLWFIWFYLLFHSILNTIGELLKFSDRRFYLDWWNSKDLATFWRLWNMPVHNWCLRHLFIPVLKWKKSKLIASIAVFFVSAFFHEYVVSVTLNMFKIHAFMGMFVQIPLITLTAILAERFGDRAGNTMVWASLILGQPIAIMVYYHDYIIEHYNKDELGAFIKN